MMRTLILLTLCAATFSVHAASQCKSGVVHRKLDKLQIGNLQVQKVNSRKEDWRLDPKKTAQYEIFSGVGQTAAKKPDMVPVTFVSGDDKTQIYSFTQPDRKIELTMKKPEWLLPYSGIYKLMMWVVTDVKTTCTKK
jgi:hypothetical protein